MPLATQRGGHAEKDSLVQANGTQSHATRQQATEPTDRRRSQRSNSQDRYRFPHNMQHDPKPMHLFLAVLLL